MTYLVPATNYCPPGMFSADYLKILTELLLKISLSAEVLTNYYDEVIILPEGIKLLVIACK